MSIDNKFGYRSKRIAGACHRALFTIRPDGVEKQEADQQSNKMINTAPEYAPKLNKMVSFGVVFTINSGVPNNTNQRTIPNMKRNDSFKPGQTVYINSAKPAAGINIANNTARRPTFQALDAVTNKNNSQKAPNDSLIIDFENSANSSRPVIKGK